MLLKVYYININTVANVRSLPEKLPFPHTGCCVACEDE